MFRPAFLAALLGIATLAAPAHAAIVTVFDAVPAGTAAFNSTVLTAGGVPTSDTLAFTGGGATLVRPDYTISRNDGGGIGLNSYGSLTGGIVDISPAGSGPGVDAIGSGITFTFANAVNAIGFEVGDWGTCCQPSALYISFDDGAPIQVGLSTVTGDVFFNDLAEVFVAAFDDSGDFTKVQFWGDGFGEYLVAGGTVRYALLDQGSLPPTPVPEPASLALLGTGLVGLTLARRRRRA